MSSESNTPSAIEQLVSRALRDNLERIQRTSDELHQAVADVVAACGSSKPANALPPMLRAQTSAASLSAALEVLTRFVAVSLQPGPRSPFEAEISRIASSLATPAAPEAAHAPAPAAVSPKAAAPAPAPAEHVAAPPPAAPSGCATATSTCAAAPSSITRPFRPLQFTKNPRSSRLKKSSPFLSPRASQKAPALLMSTGYRPTSKNCTAARTGWPKFRCRILRCCDRSRCVSADSTRISASGCGMTLRKLTENMTGGSNPSWITRSTIFIAGWWRSSRRVMPMPSANILTPRLRSTASGSHATLASNPAASSRANYLSRALAIAVSFALLAATPLDLPAVLRLRPRRPRTRNENRTSLQRRRAAPAARRALRRPRLQRRLRKTKRRSVSFRRWRVRLHNATPGAYDKLAAFAGKNAGNVWGARAALALGYDDYNKNHTQPAMVWLTKAKSDALLGDYVLYWTAQTQRVLKQNGPAFAALQKIQTEYPNTGIKEQFLEAYAPSAMEAGKPQAAIEALEAYTGTTAKPALLLLRAQAYKQARQFSRAAKDYQLLYYKNPLSDEGKTAASGLQQVKAAMGSEYPAPSWDLQEGRAQILYNQKKYRDARLEFEKLAAGIKDPSSAHKQHALLRAAQARVQLKASPSQVSSLDDHRSRSRCRTHVRRRANRALGEQRIRYGRRHRSRRREISAEQVVGRSADAGGELLLGPAQPSRSDQILSAHRR